MNRALQRLLPVALVVFSGCGGARLSHNEIRRQIADIGTSTLVPNSISVRRVVSQSGNRAIAETSVDLAFQFERDTEASPWHIASVRLGDQNWVSVPDLLGALNEAYRKQTAAALQKLTTGVTTYRERNGTAPNARDIKTLADILHPQYMRDLVLDDGWGRPIEVEPSVGASLRFRSLGPDAQRGTADDVVTPE
jgi:hypothetical protein